MRAGGGSEAQVSYVARAPRAQSELTEDTFDQWVLPDGTPWTAFYRQENSYLLRFPDLADFFVSADGQRVEERAVPGVAPSTVQHLFLNQVLPLALSRQGKLVLHGSAVEVDGQCVAFIGESGRGKSTLAASFATRGRRFLTDDGLELVWAASGLSVVPSHPSIRLWQDSQEALVSASTKVAPAVEFTTKTRFLAGPEIAFCETARPLARIYYLGAGDADSAEIVPAKAADALLALIRNSFVLDIGEQEVLVRHFEELVKIANLPIHYHLDFPRRYDELPQVQAAIVRHAAAGAHA